MSKHLRGFLITAMLCCGYSGLFAQEITASYNNPTNLFVCDNAVFEITVTNNTPGESFQNVAITLTFPSGVTYQPTTVVNATENNIADLNTPVFEIANLNPGESIPISLQAEASCELVDAIDSGATFMNFIEVAYAGETTSTSTTPYDIETPLLVMVNVNPLNTSGMQGDTIIRTITIQNTRLGAVSSFIFTDANEGQLIISSPSGNATTSVDSLFILELNGTNFMEVGDGDELFELGEFISFTEEIIIQDCIIARDESSSLLSVSWGCNDEYCDQGLIPVQAEIDIIADDSRPELVFTPEVTLPDCFCGAAAVPQELVVYNEGDEYADNLRITLNHPNTIDAFGGIDTASIYIDSAGIQIPVETILINPSDEPNPCDLTGLYNELVLLVGDLGAGDSITIHWNAYVCAPTCDNLQIRWAYEYGYFHPCEPFDFYDGDQNINYSEQGNFLSNFSVINGSFGIGETTTMNYEINSGLLTESDQSLYVQLFIPCVQSWDGSDLVFDGQTPAIEISEAGGTTTVSAVYDLPFSTEVFSVDFDLTTYCGEDCIALNKDTLITSCPTFCIPPPSPLAPIAAIANIPLDASCSQECAPSSCALVDIPITCEPTLIYDTILAHIQPEFMIGRTNFGLPDNDNDQIVDATGVLDMNLVDDHKIIAGDTLHAEMNGLVVIDYPPFDGNHVRLNFNLWQSFIDLGNTLTIFDNSTGSYYTCSNIPHFPDPIKSYNLGVEYLVALGCNIPPDFQYENGDSILFSVDYLVTSNPLDQQGNPEIVSIITGPSFYISEEPILEINETDLLSCECPTEILLLTGYKYDIIPIIHPVPPCETSDFIEGVYFDFSLGQGNFFEYEHREFCSFLNWTLEHPDNYELVETQLTILSMQNGITLLENVPVTPTENTEDVWSLDIASLVPYALDEGFLFFFQYRFDKGCYSFASEDIYVTADLALAPSLPGPEEVTITDFENNFLRALSPNIEITVDDDDVISYDNTASWGFTLTNNPTIIASTVSGPATNCWVYPESLTGAIYDFELVNSETGAVYTAENNIFQIPDIDPYADLPLQLNALNISCEKETITLRYGWNCDPYTNPLSTPCYSRFRFLKVQSQPAEIEMEPNFPGGTFPLCSPIPYHTVDLLSVQFGAVFELEMVAVLPVGLEIIPGSCQLAYPTGTTFVNIPDPEDIGNNRFLWNIPLLDDEIGLHGLPGFLSDPENQLQIRFETIANCDFIAGSYIVFEASGAQNCPEPTNNLTKAGQPINIDSAAPSYSTNISIEQGNMIVCNDETTLDVVIAAGDNTMLGDSVFVVLPPGVTYIPGSYNPIENADSNEPTVNVDAGQQRLHWPLLTGITPEQSISFEVGIAGFSEFECGQEFILAQTVSTTDALCVESSEDCSILVETGSSFANIEINRPVLEIASFQISIDESFSTLEYGLIVENSSATSSVPTVIDFYIDNDGNGVPSAADTWLFADSIMQAIGQNGSFLLSDLVNWNMNNDFCNLMAYINPENHCVCDGDVQLAQSPVNIAYPNVLNVCSDLSTMIGIAETPGHSYQWTPQDGVACPACASTEITVVNESEQAETLNLTLIEGVGTGCYIYHNFVLNILPLAQIFADSDSICLGSSVELTAAEGLAYSWTGAGVDGLTDQVVTISPTINTVYTVEIDNGTDCVDTASFDVFVNELPEANAGEDQISCNGLAGNLDAEVNEGYTYSWSPANLLSNPEITDPFVLTNDPTTFTLTVTDENGCTDTDEVFAYFNDSLSIMISANTEICEGGSTMLTVSGADSYQWSPEDGLDCTTSTCDIVNVFPMETTLYTVVATDVLGCTASLSVTVVVSNNVNTSEDRFLCPGETTIIDGVEISEAGEYCNSETIGDCDSTHCITVALLDSVYVEEFETICLGDSTLFNGEYYSMAGTYCEAFPRPDECDSIHCLVLSINMQMNTDTIFASICEGDSILFYGNYYDMAGIYTETVPQQNECDSIHYLILSFDPPIETELIEIINAGDSILFNGIFYNEPGTYCDTLSVSSGCDTIACLILDVLVEEVCDTLVAVPTVFMPNSTEDKNKVFKIFTPTGSDIVVQVKSMKIFNRWGQKIFESTEPDAEWDGTFKDAAAPPDVYIFLIEAECPDAGPNNLPIKLQGEITLIR